MSLAKANKEVMKLRIWNLDISFWISRCEQQVRSRWSVKWDVDSTAAEWQLNVWNPRGHPLYTGISCLRNEDGNVNENVTKQ